MSAFLSRSVAWAAGLFEGEGSIGTFKTKQGETPRLILAMVDRDVVERFRDIVGMGRLCVNRRRPPYQSLLAWDITSFEKVQALIAMWWPWLGERRRAKAKDVLTRALARRRTACPAGHPYSHRNTRGVRMCRICAQAADRRSASRRQMGRRLAQSVDQLTLA
jgi:hypothetical protein